MVGFQRYKVSLPRTRGVFKHNVKGEAIKKKMPGNEQTQEKVHVRFPQVFMVTNVNNCVGGAKIVALKKKK